MELDTLFELCRIGVEVDVPEKKITIIAGPVTLKLPLARVRELCSDQPTVARLLSSLFIQRGVMWEEFHREDIDDCIRSLRELQTLASKEAAKFAATRRSRDQEFAIMLYEWANCCDQAATELEQWKETERDPVETGMDIAAPDLIAPVLGTFRRHTYPIVGVLVGMLANGNTVKEQASRKLEQGKTHAVRRLGVTTDQFQSARFEISS